MAIIPLERMEFHYSPDQIPHPLPDTGGLEIVLNIFEEDVPIRQIVLLTACSLTREPLNYVAKYLKTIRHTHPRATKVDAVFHYLPVDAVD